MATSGDGVIAEDEDVPGAVPSSKGVPGSKGFSRNSVWMLLTCFGVMSLMILLLWWVGQTSLQSQGKEILEALNGSSSSIDKLTKAMSMKTEEFSDEEEESLNATVRTTKSGMTDFVFRGRVKSVESVPGMIAAPVLQNLRQQQRGGGYQQEEYPSSVVPRTEFGAQEPSRIVTPNQGGSYQAAPISPKGIPERVPSRSESKSLLEGGRGYEGINPFEERPAAPMLPPPDGSTTYQQREHPSGYRLVQVEEGGCQCDGRRVARQQVNQAVRGVVEQYSQPQAQQPIYTYPVRQQRPVDVGSWVRGW